MRRSSHRTETPCPCATPAEAYGSLAKFLHWAIVLLIVPQYFLAEAAEELPDGLEKLQIFTWHKSLGMLVLLLALARIAWKVMNKGLPDPSATPGSARQPRPATGCCTC